MYQLVSKDEYGTLNIIKTFDNLEDLEIEAKKIVRQENMENALTLSEKLNDWEVCWPEFFDSDGEQLQVFYSGRKGSKGHLVYIGGEEKMEVLFDSLSAEVRFFIGDFIKDKKETETETYHAKDHKNNIVNDFNNDLINTKTILFIKIV